MLFRERRDDVYKNGVNLTERVGTFFKNTINNYMWKQNDFRL